jgi:hypothetical protein
MREWFVIVAGATVRHADGAYLNEVMDYFFEVDGHLDGDPIDPAHPGQRLLVERALVASINSFEAAGLLSHRMIPPRQGSFTPSLGLRLLDEPQWSLSKRGRRLASEPPRRQQLSFLRIHVWKRVVEPLWARYKLAAGAVAPVFATLKYVLHWQDEKAAIAAAIAAAAILLNSLGLPAA